MTTKIVRPMLCLMLAAAALVGVNASPAAAATTVSGTVMCVTQRGVVGVWIQAESGGSGWATRTNINGYTQSYRYSLPNGGRYQVHVGCGGSPSAWQTTNRSGYVSGSYNSFTCYDTPSAYYMYKVCQRT